MIVTDHHLRPATSLPDAEAIINPTRDCDFAAGGRRRGVYLMLACCEHISRRDKARWLDERNIAPPNLAELLDLVALGNGSRRCAAWTPTTALDPQGLSRIRAGKCRPGIKSVAGDIECDPQQLAASDLAAPAFA